MRLDKYVSQGLFISRQEAKKLIQQKLIEVNSTVNRDSSYQVQMLTDQVTYNNLVINLVGFRYFIMNKPSNFVCSNQDDGYPSVLNLLEEPKLDSLHFAGRLDADSTGLLLITDDGQWSHRITIPSSKNRLLSTQDDSGKVYQVTLDRPISLDAITLLENGVLLRSETEPTLPAKVVQLDTHHIEITIHEGRYHQVKRMLAAVGNHVIALHRVQIGGLVLDSALEPGEYRSLTRSEIALFDYN